MTTTQATSAPNFIVSEASAQLYVELIQDMLDRIKKKRIKLSHQNIVTFKQVTYHWQESYDSEVDLETPIEWFGMDEATLDFLLKHSSTTTTATIDFEPLTEAGDDGDSRIIVFRNGDKVGLAVHDQSGPSCKTLEVSLFVLSMISSIGDASAQQRAMQHLFQIAANLRGICGPLK